MNSNIECIYAVWYHLYNLKNVKNTHGGPLLLVRFRNFHKMEGKGGWGSDFSHKKGGDGKIGVALKREYPLFSY